MKKIGRIASVSMLTIFIGCQSETDNNLNAEVGPADPQALEDLFKDQGPVDESTKLEEPAILTDDEFVIRLVSLISTGSIVDLPLVVKSNRLGFLQFAQLTIEYDSEALFFDSFVPTPSMSLPIPPLYNPSLPFGPSCAGQTTVGRPLGAPTHTDSLLTQLACISTPGHFCNGLLLPANEYVYLGALRFQRIIPSADVPLGGYATTIKMQCLREFSGRLVSAFDLVDDQEHAMGVYGWGMPGSAIHNACVKLADSAGHATIKCPLIPNSSGDCPHCPPQVSE